MRKLIIKLTESDLHRIIKESVKKIIKEAQFDVTDKTWITYGLGTSFNKDLFTPPDYNWMNTMFTNKPKGGLWASPVDSKWGWKDWCERENFGKLDSSFMFKLKPNAKIYVVDDLNDLKQISTREQPERYKVGNMKGIDYQKLIQNGYDGIFVTENAAGMFHCYVDDETQDLNAWDCESICIFNPNVIIPLK